MCFWGSKSCTLLARDFPLGISETFFSFLLLRSSKIFPPSDVPLLKIQLVAILVYSEGKLSDLVRLDIVFSFFL
jgi:hypothetical protein